MGIENHEIKDEMQRVRETNRVKQKDKTRVRESTKSGRIIVRNLHWRVDEKRLRHLFGSVGVITEVQIPQQAGKKIGGRSTNRHILKRKFYQNYVTIS